MASVSHNKLFIYDCCIGKLRVSDSDFMTIGASAQNTFRMHMQEARGGAFAIRGNTCHFYPNGQISSFSLNGKLITSDCQISTGVLHLLVLGTGCFLLWYGKDDERPDFAPMDPSNWYIYNKKAAEWTGPISMGDLPQIQDSDDSPLLATFPGLDGQAFFLKDIKPVAEHAPETLLSPQSPRPAATPVPQSTTTQAAEKQSARPTGGKELVCPHCQHRFTEDEMLAIASHRDLRGDDILGHTAMKRFSPEKFDSRGIAIDNNGALSPETACPGCHLALPPFFKHTHQHVIPLIGASGSGKTYYLVSMLHQMEADLPRLFNTAFRDADTGGNATIERLKHQVFSARTPRQTYIGPTMEDGKFYQQVWENGQFKTQPRPLTFNINSGSQSHSLVLYDYAGQSSNNGERRNLHMLKSPSACMFMYDPCADAAFSRLLTDNQQDEIQDDTWANISQTAVLTETELQLRLNFNTPHGHPVPLPMAFIIGKLDIWQHLLGPEPLLPIVHGGKIIREHIQANSRRIRQLLFNINPAICANAESLSANVCYFALSSMGSAPVRFRDSDTGEILSAPNPADLHPTGVTAPLLWLLSNVVPAPLSAT